MQFSSFVFTVSWNCILCSLELTGRAYQKLELCKLCLGVAGCDHGETNEVEDSVEGIYKVLRARLQVVQLPVFL